jgi:type II restriction/modification system DNA methylase subunit YeeA
VLHQVIESPSDERAKIAAVLEINVLDPAMGSGHFLVEATEQLAQFLTELSTEREPSSDASDEVDVTYWKRPRGAQSCSYGVDLNPLAVDLAKFSIWLSTAAKDRPLSFLDFFLLI